MHGRHTLLARSLENRNDTQLRSTGARRELPYILYFLMSSLSVLGVSAPNLKKVEKMGGYDYSPSDNQ